MEAELHMTPAMKKLWDNAKNDAEETMLAQLYLMHNHAKLSLKKQPKFIDQSVIAIGIMMLAGMRSRKPDAGED